MSKVVRSHRGFKIKDNEGKAEYVYTIYNKDGEYEWDCDTLQEAIDWINCY